MSKTLVIIGLIVIAVGLSWPWLSRLPIGHLPGDIMLRRAGFTLYFPITSMISISAVLSLLAWLFGR